MTRVVKDLAHGMPWTSLEVLILAAAVGRHGTADWDDVAMELASRNRLLANVKRTYTPELCHDFFEEICKDLSLNYHNRESPGAIVTSITKAGLNLLKKEKEALAETARALEQEIKASAEKKRVDEHQPETLQLDASHHEENEPDRNDNKEEKLNSTATIEASQVDNRIKCIADSKPKVEQPQGIEEEERKSTSIDEFYETAVEGPQIKTEEEAESTDAVAMDQGAAKEENLVQPQSFPEKEEIFAEAVERNDDYDTSDAEIRVEELGNRAGLREVKAETAEFKAAMAEEEEAKANESDTAQELPADWTSVRPAVPESREESEAGSEERAAEQPREDSAAERQEEPAGEQRMEEKVRRDMSELEIKSGNETEAQERRASLRGKKRRRTLKQLSLDAMEMESKAEKSRRARKEQKKKKKKKKSAKAQPCAPQKRAQKEQEAAKEAAEESVRESSAPEEEKPAEEEEEEEEEEEYKSCSPTESDKKEAAARLSAAQKLYLDALGQIKGHPVWPSFEENLQGKDPEPVLQPMKLSRVEQSVVQGLYPAPPAFIRDLLLLFSNPLTWQSNLSRGYECAITLRDHSVEVLKGLFPEEEGLLLDPEESLESSMDSKRMKGQSSSVAGESVQVSEELEGKEGEGRAELEESEEESSGDESEEEVRVTRKTKRVIQKKKVVDLGEVGRWGKSRSSRGDAGKKKGLPKASSSSKKRK